MESPSPDFLHILRTLADRRVDSSSLAKSVPCSTGRLCRRSTSTWFMPVPRKTYPNLLLALEELEAHFGIRRGRVLRVKKSHLDHQVTSC